MRRTFISMSIFFLISIVSSSALLCGDCDGDNRITILDALIASRHSVGLVQLQEPQFSACNVAGTLGSHFYPQAQVSSADSLRIAQRTVGKVNNLECILNQPLIFTSRRLGGLGVNEIYTINIDSSNETRVQFNGSASSQEIHPSWSPDGQWILFSSNRDGDMDLYRLQKGASPTTEPERLTNLTNNEIHARWSPDGKEIVFSSSQSGQFELYILNLQTDNITQITNSTGGKMTPSWSPNGTQIVYLRNDVNDFIWRINKDGQNNVQLTSGLGIDWEVGWGITGKIAFSRFSTSPFGFQIFMMNSDGSNVTRITSEASTNHFGPSWTRDGSGILFHSDKTGGFDIYSAAPVASSQTHRITTNPAFDEYAAH